MNYPKACGFRTILSMFGGCCQRGGLLLLLASAYTPRLLGLDPCDETVTAQIHLESHHPWRPPFGLDRVGQPLIATVEVISENRPYREYWLAALLDGKEIDREVFNLSGHYATGKSPYTG